MQTSTRQMDGNVSAGRVLHTAVLVQAGFATSRRLLVLLGSARASAANAAVPLGSRPRG